MIEFLSLGFYRIVNWVKGDDYGTGKIRAPEQIFVHRGDPMMTRGMNIESRLTACQPTARNDDLRTRIPLRHS